jgi:predicted GNAT family acetyltransferase
LYSPLYTAWRGCSQEFTPLEQRGRGYASANVEGLSQRLLDAGRQYRALFTNLANLTANHIYQVIGYPSGKDFADCRFAAA